MGFIECRKPLDRYMTPKACEFTLRTGTSIFIYFSYNEFSDSSKEKDKQKLVTAMQCPFSSLKHDYTHSHIMYYKTLKYDFKYTNDFI